MTYTTLAKHQFLMTYIFNFLILFLFIACADQEGESLYQASDYAFVGEFTAGLEGPAVDKSGNLYFVNPYHNGTIGKVGTDGNFEMFIESLPGGSVANGIRFGEKGKMYLADYVGHKILSVNIATKRVTTLAYEAKMNQPNDIAIISNDILFASDPNWGASSGQLWRIDPDGSTDLLTSEMGTTNGIEVSPDEQTLYVNESAQRNLWAFDLSNSGEISNKRLLIKFEDHGLDGMRCDVKGNLYIARYGKGTIVKLSPKGEVLQEISLKGEKPTNIAFGGREGRTIYVTLQDRGFIEQFKVEDPGRAF